VIAKIRKESREAVIEEIRQKNSPSEHWKTVKFVTLTSKMVLHEKGKVVTDDDELANIMWDDFCVITL